MFMDQKIYFVNVTIHPKLISRFNGILMRIPADLFVEIANWILKSIENSKTPEQSKQF